MPTKSWFEYFEDSGGTHLIGCESLCLLKILAKDRMARKKAILVSTFGEKKLLFSTLLKSWYALCPVFRGATSSHNLSTKGKNRVRNISKMEISRPHLCVTFPKKKICCKTGV
jgi:hypothetical protein